MTSDTKGAPSIRDARIPGIRIGLVLAIAGAVILAVTVLVLLNGNDGPEVSDEPNSGTVVITIVNPYYVGSVSHSYELYLNGQLEKNGTIPVGESVIIERNLSWIDSELALLIHVVVPGISTQPEDRTVTLTPGEIERVNIMLGSA